MGSTIDEKTTDSIWEVSFSLEELPQVASELIIRLGRSNLLIEGEMGSGKTTLISALVRAQGSPDAGSSPTFGWVNSYTNVQGGALAFHFDNYRIDDPGQVRPDELWEYYRQNRPIYMEWPEKLTPAQWPTPFRWARLEFVGPTTRILRLYETNRCPLFDAG